MSKQLPKIIAISLIVAIFIFTNMIFADPQSNVNSPQQRGTPEGIALDIHTDV